MSALLESARHSGMKIQENRMDCDAAVIWSVLWAGRMAPNQQVYEHYRASGRPVIIAEVGSLVRGVTWKISVNHVTAQGHYGNQHDLDPDRPVRLGLRLGTGSTAPGILIASQHSRSLQVQDIPDMTQWVIDRVHDLLQHTDRPIFVRPHPRSALDIMRLPRNITVVAPRPVLGTYDAFDWHTNYHAIVNHNSGPGINAALAGNRPVVDSSSLAHPVSINIADIERPYSVDRQQWLIEIAYTEYTLDEIQQGTWLKRLSSWLL